MARRSSPTTRFAGVPTLTIQEGQTVSRKRVADQGEVYTAKREVTAMLDLVDQEATRIESRFLEPACGTGNFLTAILERKLGVVQSRYGNSQLDYERNAILAVSSLYGIDILEDNVAACRQRLFEVFEQQYNSLFKLPAADDRRTAVKYILERNIIWGDALTLKTVGEKPQPIVFSEWSPVNGSMLKPRDFTFHELLDQAAMNRLSGRLRQQPERRDDRRLAAHFGTGFLDAKHPDFSASRGCPETYPL